MFMVSRFWIRIRIITNKFYSIDNVMINAHTQTPKNFFFFEEYINNWLRFIPYTLDLSFLSSMMIIKY